MEQLFAGETKQIGCRCKAWLSSQASLLGRGKHSRAVRSYVKSGSVDLWQRSLIPAVGRKHNSAIMLSFHRDPCIWHVPWCGNIVVLFSRWACCTLICTQMYLWVCVSSLSGNSCHRTTQRLTREQLVSVDGLSQLVPDIMSELGVSFDLNAESLRSKLLINTWITVVGSERRGRWSCCCCCVDRPLIPFNLFSLHTFSFSHTLTHTYFLMLHSSADNEFTAYSIHIY